MRDGRTPRDAAAASIKSARLPGPLPRQGRLGDLWLPRRGIFAVGTSRFESHEQPRQHPATPKPTG